MYHIQDYRGTNECSRAVLLLVGVPIIELDRIDAVVLPLLTVT